jgi:hypothetical protein
VSDTWREDDGFTGSPVPRRLPNDLKPDFALGDRHRLFLKAVEVHRRA